MVLDESQRVTRFIRIHPEGSVYALNAIAVQQLLRHYTKTINLNKNMRDTNFMPIQLYILRYFTRLLKALT